MLHIWGGSARGSPRSPNHTYRRILTAVWARYNPAASCSQLAEARREAEALREAASRDRAAAEAEAAAARDANRAAELASLQKDLDLARRVRTQHVHGMT